MAIDYTACGPKWRMFVLSGEMMGKMRAAHAVGAIDDFWDVLGQADEIIPHEAATSAMLPIIADFLGSECRIHCGA